MTASAYQKILALRKTETRVRLAAALDCTIRAVDQFIKKKGGNEELEAAILKLSDRDLARVSDVVWRDGEQAKKAKPAAAAKVKAAPKPAKATTTAAKVKAAPKPAKATTTAAKVKAAPKPKKETPAATVATVKE